MAAMRERGFETHGLEISETIASHARERFGFDTVHIGPLEQAPYPDEHFDLITMWDVVEHVADPVSLLTRARELLAPGGLLVIETQDIDSRFARVLGPKWHHYKHEEHIYHFNPSTVETLLGQAGFRVDRLSHRYGGKYVSLHFIAERAARVHPVLTKLLMPLARFGRARVYVNFMDEMIVLARPGLVEETANRQFVELERTHFWFVGRRRIFFALLDDQLDGRGPIRILDVGCGAGGMLEPLSRYGTVTGVDMSAELVEFCHQRGFPDVVVGSAYELPAGRRIGRPRHAVRHDRARSRRCPRAARGQTRPGPRRARLHLDARVPVPVREQRPGRPPRAAVHRPRAAPQAARRGPL